MNLIYQGSVKDLYQGNSGHIIFKYSNRYSIFDWGEMPDEIPHKGEALASMTGNFFKHLRQCGMDSHFVRALDGNSVEVRAVEVLRPRWTGEAYDYEVYRARPTQCLVPFEVIFRRHLGQGNSLEGRLQKAPEYLQDLGLTEMPRAGHSFHPPLIEISTKLESSDRYLSRHEIESMSVVSEKEERALRQRTQEIAMELEQLFASFGVKLWDGKLEFAFGPESEGERELLLVDSIGPDELRLTYEGLPLSKEFLRQIYAKSSWSEAVKRSKELAKERKVPDWKRICTEELREFPQALTADQVEVSSLLYKALANEVARAVAEPLPFSAECTLPLWHQRARTLLEGAS